MIKRIDIGIDPDKAFDSARLREAAIDSCGIPPETITDVVLVRRSLDARRRTVVGI